MGDGAYDWKAEIAKEVKNAMEEWKRDPVLLNEMRSVLFFVSVSGKRRTKSNDDNEDDSNVIADRFERMAKMLEHESSIEGLSREEIVSKLVKGDSSFLRGSIVRHGRYIKSDSDSNGSLADDVTVFPSYVTVYPALSFRLRQRSLSTLATSTTMGYPMKHVLRGIVRQPAYTHYYFPRSRSSTFYVPLPWVLGEYPSELPLFKTHKRTAYVVRYGVEGHWSVSILVLRSNVLSLNGKASALWYSYKPGLKQIRALLREEMQSTVAQWYQDAYGSRVFLEERVIPAKYMQPTKEEPTFIVPYVRSLKKAMRDGPSAYIYFKYHFEDRTVQTYGTQKSTYASYAVNLRAPIPYYERPAPLAPVAYMMLLSELERWYPWQRLSETLS